MASNDKQSILVADDHNLIREGLRITLANDPDYEIIGEALNSIQAIEMASELRPNFILLNISSVELNGIDIIPVIRQKCPDTKLLLLALNVDDDSIIEGLRAGARGYLSRNSSLSDIKHALAVISRDEMWIERKLVSKVFENAKNNALTNDNNGNSNHNSCANPNLGALTQREMEVLKHLAKGSTNKEIARDLYICEKTVKSHLNRIFRKLNVSRRLEAILYAIKSGMV